MWRVVTGVHAQSKQQEAAVLAEVGDGGFSVGELEILQQLGRLSWVRAMHWGSHLVEHVPQ